MYSLFPELFEWLETGKNFALATVARTWGSSPRTVGAKMAVSQDGEIIGSVSGGCVEGAVASVCAEVIKTGLPQLLHFDVADSTAWEVGLACGGELDIFVQAPSSELVAMFEQARQSEQTLITATLIKGVNELLGRGFFITQDDLTTGSISPEIDSQFLRAFQESSRQTGSLTLPSSEVIFIDFNHPPPTLIIVGGVHIAVALTRIAKAAGYRVIIVDPRRQFATKLRFPQADQILNLWPDKALEQIKINTNTALAFLTHDPKIDDPGLVSALNSPAFYIGGLGSRKTQASRRQRLIESGVPEEQLNRIHGPIGLDLGGRRPEEIALAIMAQIVQTRNQ